MSTSAGLRQRDREDAQCSGFRRVRGPGIVAVVVSSLLMVTVALPAAVISGLLVAAVSVAITVSLSSTTYRRARPR